MRLRRRGLKRARQPGGGGQKRASPTRALTSGKGESEKNSSCPRGNEGISDVHSPGKKTQMLRGTAILGKERPGGALKT